jgi:hypothetical protein
MSVAFQAADCSRQTKPGGVVRHGVYRFKLGHKSGDFRVVDGCDQSRDIDLRQLVEHEDSPKELEIQKSKR